MSHSAQGRELKQPTML